METAMYCRVHSLSIIFRKFLFLSSYSSGVRFVSCFLRGSLESMWMLHSLNSGYNSRQLASVGAFSSSF